MNKINDCISRQAAIRTAEQSQNQRFKRQIKKLFGMSSTEPERKKGKWIDNTFCSECGWIHEIESGFIGSVNQFNFCPNCGADMREGKEN